MELMMTKTVETVYTTQFIGLYEKNSNKTENEENSKVTIAKIVAVFSGIIFLKIYFLKMKYMNTNVRNKFI